MVLASDEGLCAAPSPGGRQKSHKEKGQKGNGEKRGGEETDR